MTCVGSSPLSLTLLYYGVPTLQNFHASPVECTRSLRVCRSANGCPSPRVHRSPVANRSCRSFAMRRTTPPFWFSRPQRELPIRRRQRRGVVRPLLRVNVSSSHAKLCPFHVNTTRYEHRAQGQRSPGSGFSSSWSSPGCADGVCATRDAIDLSSRDV